MKKLLLIAAVLVLAFSCDKSDGDTAAIKISEQSQQLSLTSGAHSGVTVRYELIMPKGEEYMASTIRVSARSSETWVTNFDNPASGRLTFDVKANGSRENRTATIELSADGVRPALFTVMQEGRSDDDDDNKGDQGGDDGDDDDDDNKGDSEVSVYRSGWPELPYTYEKRSGNYTVSSKNSTLYYAHHLCPDVNNAQNAGKARNYTVCFSAEHHCPVWVAAPRVPSDKGSASRTDAYQSDPNIPANIQYNSKSTGGDCNKGHMLGSAERTRTTATNRQVFYYSNIAPQYSSNFNTGGGGWNVLEDWVDTKVCSDTTYVVIGTYFDSYKDKRGYEASPKKIEFGGRSDVSCPTMFYYLILRTKKGNTGKSVMDCSRDELMCAAFVRAHSTKWTTNTSQNQVSNKDLMTVEELEELTGFTFFANVPNAPKDSYNASDWGL